MVTVVELGLKHLQVAHLQTRGSERNLESGNEEGKDVSGHVRSGRLDGSVNVVLKKSCELFERDVEWTACRGMCVSLRTGEAIVSSLQFAHD